MNSKGTRVLMAMIIIILVALFSPLRKRCFWQAECPTGSASQGARVLCMLSAQPGDGSLYPLSVRVFCSFVCQGPSADQQMVLQGQPPSLADCEQTSPHHQTQLKNRCFLGRLELLCSLSSYQVQLFRHCPHLKVRRN